MPADPIQPFAEADGLKEALGKALGAPPPDELFKGRYLVAIWKGFRAQHPRARRLPAIVPIVVHHSRTGWTAKVAFEDLLDADSALL